MTFGTFGTNVNKPIFVSYRRTNEANISGLAIRLRESFGAEHVFIDQMAFRPGDHFPDGLKQAIQDAKVVIAIIGPHWEEALAGRAAKHQVDFVLEELRTALEANIRIIPVIVGRPENAIKAPLLPASLQGLCSLHVVHLRQYNCMIEDEAKTQNLMREIGMIPGVPRTRSGKPIPRYAPTPGRYPVSWEEIKRLGSEIFSWLSREIEKGGENLSISIWGIPGMGKSTLVEHIASDDRIFEFYPDGVLFCRVGKDATDRQVILSLEEWARKDKLDIPPADIADMERIKDTEVQLRQWQEIISRELAGRKMLLVIDDVWDEGIGRALMVGGKDCGYLFTTRQRRVANDLGNLVIPMPKLTEKQSLALLREIAPGAFFAGNSGERVFDHIKSVVQKVDGLPLALVLIGSTLKIESQNANPARHIEQALNLFDRATERLAKRIPSPGSTLKEITLAAVINASYQALNERRANGATLQRALCRLTVLRPDPESFSPELAAQVIRDLQESEAPDQKPILDQLTDSGLVGFSSYDAQSDLNRHDADVSEKELYTIHRTISDCVALYLSPAEKQSIYQSAAEYFAERLTTIEKKFQEEGTDFKSSYRYESAAWQDAMDNWRFYLMIQGDYKTAAFKFTHSWFCAFWWWGCFDNFQFCDELVRDWPTEGFANYDAEKDQHELIQILSSYPKETGERRVGKSPRWHAVRRSLERIGLARQLGGDVSDFNSEQRELRGLMSIFLAETYRYGEDNFQAAEEFYRDAVLMFEPTAGASQVSWNRPWVRYHLADCLYEAGRMDDAELITLDAYKQGQEQGDLEIQSQLLRLQADIAVSRNDLGTAIEKFNRSVANAYAFQAFSDATTENDPDGYTVQFYPMIIKRCSNSLLRLYAIDPASALTIAGALRARWQRESDGGEVRAALDSANPDNLSACLFAPIFSMENLGDSEAKIKYAKTVRDYLAAANFHFER
ncbi:tetratricopeptide (TPR) repeat protein [Caballeronia udeis]|uniref:Tetratricopeptide (TPR) repeat protein n=1 Tax=Caballeronia udeis TaxID=1232866 RepID=A0ABW8MJ36_9BURK